MAEDWAAIAAEVDAALAEVGVQATILRPGGTTGPEWNPTQGAPTEHPVRAMQDEWQQGEIDGTLIRMTDRKLIVSATGAAPTTEDRITFGGQELAIAMVQPLAPAGDAVLYTVAARA